MDTTKLEVLEKYVQRLLLELAGVKEDNSRLTQTLTAMQHSLQEQTRALDAYNSAQAELRDLRLVTQALRHERDLIRAKLETILDLVAHLEEISSTVIKA